MTVEGMANGNLTGYEKLADDVMKLRYSHIINGRKETWPQIARRVTQCILKNSHLKIPRDIIRDIQNDIETRKFPIAGRIASQTGREYHQIQSCFLLRAEDTREGWAKVNHDSTLMFFSGGGVGVDYSNIRPAGSYLKSSGGESSGPIPLIQCVNSIAQAAEQGGKRKGAAYASLRWNHKDVFQFINLKQESGTLKHTNISVRFDKEWFKDITEAGDYWEGTHAGYVFLRTLESACKYGDPGFQFDTDDQVLRNACTEVISNTDSDSCTISPLNLARIESVQELSDITERAIIFLLACTEYSDYPTRLSYQIKMDTRRLGLGIMGMAEWFIQRGLRYGNTCLELHNWMSTYRDVSIYAARKWSEQFNMPIPVALRAIAPTGTISIAGGHTTQGIEPVFHTAYKRTYNHVKGNSNGIRQEVVIEPIVRKLLNQGYDLRDVDTAYSLSSTSEGIERRLKFQSWLQQFVDNGISSTVNLPRYTTGFEDNIRNTLLQYLPTLRGVTFYPDGRHENQPMVPIELHEALRNESVKMQISESCKGDLCGF